MNAFFSKNFEIDGVTLGEGQPIYIVAEMSANHGQDYEKAVEIIHEAKLAGANAVKLQTYTADTLTLESQRPEFYISEGPWKGQYMHDLYQGAYMPWEWHEPLQQVAKDIGITLFSAPFDHSAVTLLEKLDFPAYKIASPELIDLDLIRRVAETGKPIIISTGSGTLSEIHQAIDTVLKTGNTNLCLMKCTSNYPAPLSDMNLNTIPHLQAIYGGPVGLSDHSLGIAVPTVSVGLGVNMIEKHFIVSKTDSTADSFFSLDKEEFSQMVKAIREAEAAMGKVDYPLATNSKRRSLYASEDIEMGDLFSVDNIRNLRPGVGIAPKHLSNVVGRIAKRRILRGEPLIWDVIG